MMRFGQGFKHIGRLHNVILLGWRAWLGVGPNCQGHSLDLMGYYKSTTHKLDATHESSRNTILIMRRFDIWIDWMSVSS